MDIERNLRTLVITSPITGVTYHLFNGPSPTHNDPYSKTDSEALHDALCRIDPGEIYSIQFRPSE